MSIDWNSLTDLTPTQIKMFGESREFGIDLQGVTFPLLGPKNEHAVLNFMSDPPQRGWPDYNR
jgi:hypothetical protein